jgi:peptidoglycan/LPS O-acetylase OafA/YrhL
MEGAAFSDIKQSERPRLAFIDGLRGIAIALVMLRHYYLAIYDGHLPRWADVMGLGYLGVHLFLVLSGFCVAWALVGTRPREMSLREFAARRAGRILPAYYVALILSMLLALPALTELFHMPPIPLSPLPLQIASHLTMTHNLFPETVLAINGVFWTLALECQLYVTFPLVLEGYRKLGVVVTLCIVLGLQTLFRLYVGRHLTPGAEGVLTFMTTWSVFGRMGEFALGVYAAVLVGRISRGEANPLPSAWILNSAALLCFAAGIMAKKRLGETAIPTDAAFMTGFFLLVLSGSRSGAALNKVLSWRPLVGLGIISYSVYLVHGLITFRICSLLNRHFTSTRLLVFGILPVLAITLLLSYGFYRFAEKPFLDRRARRLRSTAPVTAQPEAV